MGSVNSQVLRKEGIVILTVPAFKFLWGIQDVVTGIKGDIRRKRSRKIKGRRIRDIEILLFQFYPFFSYPDCKTHDSSSRIENRIRK